MGILGHNPTVIQEASVYIFKLKYKTQENVWFIVERKSDLIAKVFIAKNAWVQNCLKACCWESPDGKQDALLSVSKAFTYYFNLYNGLSVRNC